MRLVLLALFILTSGLAHADVAEPLDADAPTRPVEDPMEAYPFRIVAADAGSFAAFGIGGLFLLGAAFGERDAGTPGLVFVSAGILGYAAGAPLLHLEHGNPRGAMRSALARAGLPLLGATLVYLSDRSGDEDRPVYGAVGGVGVAMLLDWTVFARMPTKTTLPFVAPASDGVQAGIAGTF